MKKSIYILILIFISFKTHSYEKNYKDISKIEMEVLRDDQVIGHSNYSFRHSENEMMIINDTKFEVELFGIKIFSVISKSTEKYKNGKLFFFKSNTLQNNKKKYVNLSYDEKKKKFIIDGSSYKGEADLDNIIGNWWNSKILSANSQISPLSGSIKKQNVKLLKKEKIEIYGKNYEVLHFKLKSNDESLPDNKKLNFDIWLDPHENIIVKVVYERMGKWEYRLKQIK